MTRKSEAAYTVITGFELFQIWSESLDAWFAYSYEGSSRVSNAETSSQLAIPIRLSS